MYVSLSCDRLMSYCACIDTRPHGHWIHCNMTKQLLKMNGLGTAKTITINFKSYATVTTELGNKLCKAYFSRYIKFSGFKCGVLHFLFLVYLDYKDRTLLTRETF